MKYLGHILTALGAALVLAGVFANDWFLVGMTEVAGLLGRDTVPGKVAAILAVLVVLQTVGAVVIRRRALIVSETITALFMFAVAAWAYFDAYNVVFSAQNVSETALSFEQVRALDIAIGDGYYWLILGGFLVLMGALRVFAQGPDMSPDRRPLRVAMLWNGSVIKEQIFDEPHDVTIGEDIRCNFTVPAGLGLDKRFVLFYGSRNGTYDLGLVREMEGRLSIGGKKMSVSECIAGHTSGSVGSNSVQLTTDDWGLLHTGPLSIFFQFIQPEAAVAKTGLAAFDANMLATTSSSAVMHLALILMCLFLWEENEDIKRRAIVFKQWDVDAIYDEEEEEEEEEDEGKEEDTTGKKAEGEEGKFGDPDIDPMIESKVPNRDGKMVSKIDPKKVGLVDMLSTNQLGGIGAIANILSDNTQGLANKMAVAMSGAGTESVMGHGSGGMGFKGTGTGGGGIGGYGRIHGLGMIDTGGGTGMHASLGRKRI
jgi:hypothetical protein